MGATVNARVERALYGPSVAEVTLGALLSVVLGAVLAVIYLMMKPVETVTERPAEPETGIVYYVPGSANATKGRQYLRKKQLFLEGGSAEVIGVTEDELNAWIASSRANPDAAATGLLAPQSVNFRVRDGVFQIGLPCELNLFGYNRPIIVQARGGFTKRGDRFVFAPEELYVGSLALSRLPGLTTLFVNRLLAAQNIPPEPYAAWKRLDRVEVADDQLMLAQP